MTKTELVYFIDYLLLFFGINLGKIRQIQLI